MKTGLAAKFGKDEQAGKYPYIRPKDAATLLILEGKGKDTRVLMGRRHMRHTFMPGKFVFPGGRLDPSDSRISVVRDYHPVVEAKLSDQLKGPKTPARVRAFALAAIRETYEEAGLFIGRKVDHAEKIHLGKGFEDFATRSIMPDLEPLRMIARAITPPNRSRRFDTRFLAVSAHSIADRLESGTGPSGELEDIAWLTLDEAASMDELPMITRQILQDLGERLEFDPDLAPESAVPFYFYKNGDFQKNQI
ncbi:NUDIX hydrolase [Roseibium algae]|uniref:NUDIX domain-containing protein n=1 Tax=Roseibium algae TaxID=3123038 RepID=A0ABU8TQR7_9HYPH